MKKVEFTMIPLEMPSVNISDLSQGKASKIINKVHNESKEIVIMKNNKPMAVILPYSKYAKRGLTDEK